MRALFLFKIDLYINHFGTTVAFLSTDDYKKQREAPDREIKDIENAKTGCSADRDRAAFKQDKARVAELDAELAGCNSRLSEIASTRRGWQRGAVAGRRGRGRIGSADGAQRALVSKDPALATWLDATGLGNHQKVVLRLANKARSRR